MAGGARLPDRAAAKLLLAAGLIDAVFVLLLLEMIRALAAALAAEVAPELAATLRALPPEIAAAAHAGSTVALFLALLVGYWLVCDVLLGGRSIGRAVQMLRPQDAAGRRATRWQLTKRGLLKASRLGLTGIDLARRAAYDAAAGIRWASPLAAAGASAARNWAVEVRSGRSAGESRLLGRIGRFSAHGVVQIGRDPNWADIVLSEDERVSAHHAILRLRGGRWQLCDYGGGRGSRNGTRLGGRRLPPRRWVGLSAPAVIHVANVELRLVKQMS